MPKPPPEKLAAALRANLLRRKQPGRAEGAAKPPEQPSNPAPKPPKSGG